MKTNGRTTRNPGGGRQLRTGPYTSAIFAASILIVSFSAATGQTTSRKKEPSRQDVIRAERREVIVDISVTDAEGIPVRTLKKTDFTLIDDGRPREIDAFTGPSRESEPLEKATGSAQASTSDRKAAIILDQVNAYFEDASYARQQVLNVLRQLPKDEYVALYTIVRDRGLVLLQDYTTDRDLLTRSIQSNTPVAMTAKPVSGPIMAGGSTGQRSVEFNHGIDQPFPPGLADGIDAAAVEKEAMWRQNVDAARSSFQAIAQTLQYQPGRKNVFWVGDAFPPRYLGGAEQLAWDKAIADLNESDVAINTIDAHGVFRGANPTGGTIATMQELADRTGGKAWFGRNDLDGALKEAISASRAIYTFRFHLGDDEPDNQFHTLRVTVDRPGLKTFYRQGYYAGAVGGPLESVNSHPAVSPISVQLPYFYSALDRVRVHMTLDGTYNAALNGKLTITGVASASDGTEAARFSESVDSVANGLQGESSPAPKSWHYEHEFAVAAGTYAFQLEINSGSSDFHASMPLHIEALNARSIGIGSVVIGTLGVEPPTSPPAEEAAPDPIIVNGKTFIINASQSFQNLRQEYFYVEIYSPGVSGQYVSAPALNARIFDKATGDVEFDSGIVDLSDHVRRGSPSVCYSAPMPTRDLAPGSYRLEVRATLAGSQTAATSVIDFDVK